MCVQTTEVQRLNHSFRSTKKVRGKKFLKTALDELELLKKPKLDFFEVRLKI